MKWRTDYSVKWVSYSLHIRLKSNIGYLLSNIKLKCFIINLQLLCWVDNWKSCHNASTFNIMKVIMYASEIGESVSTHLQACRKHSGVSPTMQCRNGNVHTPPTSAHSIFHLWRAFLKCCNTGGWEQSTYYNFNLMLMYIFWVYYHKQLGRTEMTLDFIISSANMW